MNGACIYLIGPEIGLPAHVGNYVRRCLEDKAENLKTYSYSKLVVNLRIA